MCGSGADEATNDLLFVSGWIVESRENTNQGTVTDLIYLWKTYENITH